AGARAYLSRPIGGAAAGRWRLQHGWSVDGGPDVPYAQREFAMSAIRRHVDPEPEVRLGRELAQIDQVTACIDVSDGLSSDLHHLCDASAAGADIERERIPIFPDLLGNGLGIPVQECVLHGGEEYARLFTSSQRESELSTRLGRHVFALGRIKPVEEVR